MAKKNKKKPHYGFFPSQNRLEKEEKERKQKLFFCSVPTRREIQNSKKREKNKKIPLWLHFMPKQVGKCREREKIKIVFPFPSDRTGNRKFQKKRRKFKKNQKIQLWLHFKPKQDGKGLEREKKNYRFVSFRTDALEKIQEKQQKNSIN